MRLKIGKFIENGSFYTYLFGYFDKIELELIVSSFSSVM